LSKDLKCSSNASTAFRIVVVAVVDTFHIRLDPSSVVDEPFGDLGRGADLGVGGPEGAPEVV
jgi:hypothetical protein